MTRTEISGYIQIVVGAVGIVLTLLTAPSILDAFGEVAAGEGLPPALNSVRGGIQVFGVMLILSVLVLLVVVGASITLSTLFKAAGATRPILSASCLVVGAIGMAGSASLGIFGHLLWVPAFIGSFGALLVSTIAAHEKPESDAAIGVGVLFVMLFLLTGLFTLAAMGNAAREAREENMWANLAK